MINTSRNDVIQCNEIEAKLLSNRNIFGTLKVSIVPQGLMLYGEEQELEKGEALLIKNMCC